MRDEFENIDDLFASELKDYSPQPPVGMWDNIEKRVANGKSVKLVPLFYKIAAGVALLIFGTFAGIYFFGLNVEDSAIALQNNVVETKQYNGPKLEIHDVETVGNEKSGLLQSELKPVSAFEKRAGNTANRTNSNNPLLKEKETGGLIIADKEEQQNDIEPNYLLHKEAGLISNDVEEAIISKEEEKPEYTDAYLALLSEFEEIEYSEEDKDKWAVGGQAGPQYSYRKITSEYSSQEYLDLYNQSESGIMAYAGGVNVAYKPARRLSIQTGVYYSKIGQTAQAQVVENWERVDASVMMTESDYTPDKELRVASSMGSVSSTDLPKADNTAMAASRQENISYMSVEEVQQVSQYLEFLEVPVIARYAVVDRKFNFHFLGGLSTNFLIASPVYLDNGEYYSSTQDLNKVNYSSTVGLGLGYKFSSSVSLNIEPQFKYYLNKVNTNTNTDVHPYSFGIFTGVTYLF